MGDVRLPLICLTLFIQIIGILTSELKLEKLATLYLPFNYFGNGSAQFGYDESAVEQIAYDPVDRILYTAGGKIVQIIDLAHVSNPTIVSYKLFEDTAELTDIEYCGGFVLLARQDGPYKERGYVEIYRKYNRYQYNLELLHVIEVGTGPEHIQPTSDCRKILIALEGEVYSDGRKLIDPLGGIGILTFRTSDLSRRYRYQTEDFTSFIDRTAELVRNGTRYIYRTQSNTIAHDLEPETITLNENETKAYISLQENNAIAEFDMKTDTITAIHPLGFKNWRFSKFDASDRDNGINIRPWPVLGMYQPDSIRYLTINGRGYVVSANEGDSKDFSGDVPNGFSEEARAGDLTLSRGSPIRTWARANGFDKTILLPSNLGRLQVTNLDGKLPNSNTYQHLFSFGTRSFSIWRARDMRQVFDSGSDFEDAISRFKPSVFNADSGKTTEIPSSTADFRSDDKGPEPETIEIGEYKGRKLIFIGHEDPGGILMYSIRENPRQPQFEDIWSGVPDTKLSWEELYNRNAISEVDAEGLRFVPQSQSPIGQPLLIASGAVTGTVSIFKIVERSVGFNCRGKPSGLYPDVTDCTKYYNCHYGTTFKMSCPVGLYFSKIQSVCDWPENVKC